MLAYRIQSHGAFPLDSKPQAFTLKNLSGLKEKLATSKNALDKHFSDKRFQRAWSALDPFRDERAVVAFIGNIGNMNKNVIVTNAWLKCYEMINYFNITSNANQATRNEEKEFIHFDNASFPGTFILATQHYIATHSAQSNTHATLSSIPLSSYKWYGSSLIEQTAQDREPLEDKFGLMRKYPEHWLMDLAAGYNGDVLNEKNQLYFKEKLGGRVALYTSDLGFDVSEDYNRQEIFHARANAGQILSSLLTLREGGTMITKQYMFFEGISISMIYGLTFMFDELYIVKPATSRAANSEVYLVGKGARRLDDTNANKFITLLFDVISERIPVSKSLFAPADLPKKFLTEIIHAACGIFERQIAVVDANVAQALKNKDWHANSSLSSKANHINATQDKLVEEWYINNYVLPIDDSDKLV